MSIQIGVNATGGTALTNNERIFLQSSVHSNMITLKSSLNQSRLWFDGDLTFGRSNTSLVFSKLDVPFAIFHPDQIRVSTPSVFTEVAQFQYPVTMQTLNTTLLRSCNLEVNASSATTTTPLLAVYDHLQKPVISSFASGVTYLSGSVGIGTTSPQQALHVQGDAKYSGLLTASNISANSIRPVDALATEIQMTTLSNINIIGHVVISETLTVIGGISQDITEVDFLTVNDGFTAPYVTLNNIAQKSPTIDILHQYDTLSEFAPCNIINITTFDGIESAEIMTLTPSGSLGIGTSEPQGLLDIRYNMMQGTSDILNINGANDLARIVIDCNANVGLGTSQPQHVLHLHRPSNSVVSSKAMMALYNEPTAENAPMLVAYSNIHSVFHIADNGSTTIGDIPVDPNWGLAATSIKTSWLQPDFIVANAENGCNIYFNESHLSNIGDYFGKNMNVSEFVSTSNLRTRYFYSEDFEIPGLQIFNNDNYFSILMETMIHKGSNIVFSPNIDDLYKDPIVNGKVRIHAPNALTPSGTVVGLNVIGASNTISQVTSYAQPILKLVHNDVNANETTEAVMKLENNAFRILHTRTTGSGTTGATLLPLQINDKGAFIHRSLFVGTNQRVGINLGRDGDINPTLPSYNLQMKGSASFQTDTGADLLFMNGDGGNVGIGTNAPVYKLQVEGISFTRNNHIVRGSAVIGTNAPASTSYALYVDGSSYGTGNMINMGNVGVGTTNPLFKLDVVGNINFTGDLYQRGSAYVSSQWTTNGQGVFITGSNVGIGTTNPLASLHVNSTSFFNGNVGLGTTIPQGALHVQSGRVILPTSVGIGTTVPLFPLHVRGDINFDGNLFQNGTRYISSQWTSTSDGKGIYVLNSNVGIGTTTPQYGLHVTLPAYFSSNVIFDSNVNVNGLLSTRGNIASISDQRYKTNLSPISDPMDRIERMTGYTYDRIDLGHRECGLIAQDVQRVLPEVVFTQPENEVLTIAYGNLAALFVEGMKELQSKVRLLEQEIDQLKAASTRS